MLRMRKAQSTAEYAIVLSLVVAAIIGMQVYVRRGISARIKTGSDAMATAGANTQISVGGRNVTIGSLRQYEPYYTESAYDTYQENIEREQVSSGVIKKEKVSDITVRGAGGQQIQRGAVGATARETPWNTSFGQ